MPKLKKRQSKRVTFKVKYKIQRKVKEHNRKAKRDAKRDAKLHPKRIKKDPGIPNLYPYKEELLDKMIRSKELEKQNLANQKETRKKLLQERRAHTIQEIANNASQMEIKYTEIQKKKHDLSGVDFTRLGDGARKSYYREFKKVIEQSDVVLEVLDARDPIGCRCKAVEQMIMSKAGNKRIVLILNKIDLVPQEVVQNWLKYLRHELPTVLFKSSTQKKRGGQIKQSHTPIDQASIGLLNSTECLGAETLIQLLKNYCRSKDIKTSICVGVIGYPNVGKSSLINSLKRSRAVGVGATPGFTKTMQEIHLDKNIRLLDCPGIVFSTDSEASIDVTLRNCVKPEIIDDPVAVVEAILNRCKKNILLELYNIPIFQGVNEFLANIARKKGKMKPGGILDLVAAARSVIHDWNQGKIPYYTKPPSKRTEDVESSIVTEWSKEFKVDEAFEKAQSAVIEGLPVNKADKQFMELDTDNDGVGDEQFTRELEQETENMDEDKQNGDSDEGSKVEVRLPKKNKKEYAGQNLADEEDDYNPQTNQNRKKEMKKKKKQEKKNRKVQMDFEEESDDDSGNERQHFDFGRDFVPAATVDASEDSEDDSDDGDEEGDDDNEDDDAEDMEEDSLLDV